MNPNASSTESQHQQIAVIPPMPLSTTEAFVQAFVLAMDIPPGGIGGGGGSKGKNTRMHVVASCALAVAASAVANAAARRITEVPDVVMSFATAMAMSVTKNKKPAAAASGRPAGSRMPLPWDVTRKPSTFVRFLRFVLRLLRPYMGLPLVRPLVHFFVRVVELLERRATLSGTAARETTLHVTVPEKCTNDYYGAKPNIVFADLVWYAMTHESTVAHRRPRACEELERGAEGGEGGAVDGLEVVQDAAGGARELRPSMLGNEVVRVYAHGEHRIFMVLTTDVVTNTLGTKAAARSVKLSAAPLDDSSSGAAPAGHAPINAFIAHVQEARTASQRDLVWKPVVNHWVDGAWKERHIPNRKRFEHVAMRAAEKRALTADVDAFLGSEATYLRMGLCWNRGYLLHGPPGCGKSSCVSAMACTYRLPVYSVNLREVAGDVELRKMFASLPERVMVVMEDVDCMTDSVLAARISASASRDDGGDGKGSGNKSNSKVSLSGLLNVLDGIETGGGRLLVMTTNHKDALDPALVRPGRCDVHLEVGYSTFEHAAFLTRLYLGDAAAAALDETALTASFAAAKVTPAEVTGVLLPLATTKLAAAGDCSGDPKLDEIDVSQQLVELCERIAAAEAAAAAAAAAKVAEAAAEKVAAAAAVASASAVASAAAVASVVAASTAAAAAAAAQAPELQRQSSSGSYSSSSSSTVSVYPATPPG